MIAIRIVYFLKEKLVASIAISSEILKMEINKNKNQLTLEINDSNSDPWYNMFCYVYVNVIHI